MRRLVVGLLLALFAAPADALDLRGIPLPLTYDGTAVTSTVPLRLPVGTSTIPAYSFTNDADSGFYSVSDNVIGLTEGGILRHQFTPTQLAIVSATGGVIVGGDTIIARTDAGFFRVTTGFDKPAASAAAANPATNNVRFYVREDIDQGSGTGTADCAFVARLTSGTEVLIQVLVTDGGC
jgi:hypothetical protein